MKSAENTDFKNLSNHELVTISGGEIDGESSFFYDVMWVIGCAARAIAESIENAEEYDPQKAWLHRA